MIYLLVEIDSAYCTNLSSETHAAVWGPIELLDVHFTKTTPEVAPDVSSESISYSEPDSVLPVTLFLWVQINGRYLKQNY